MQIQWLLAFFRQTAGKLSGIERKFKEPIEKKIFTNFAQVLDTDDSNSLHFRELEIGLKKLVLNLVQL